MPSPNATAAADSTAVDRNVAWCEAHHIIHWLNNGVPTGDTKFDNLVLMCSHHHHLIHRQQWHIKLHTNADVTVTHPDGRSFTTQPRGTPNIREPVPKPARQPNHA